MSKRLKLGPTGLFPEGKIRRDDDGQLRIAIVNSGGKVILDFGTPTAWIGFGPREARLLAAALSRHADEAEQSGRGHG